MYTHFQLQASTTHLLSNREILNDSVALYDGSTHTLMSTLVEYFRWFCEHPGTSKEAFSSMLAMQKSILPTPNVLPGSYEAALRIIEPHIISTVSFDICDNDCVLFRNEYSSLMQCPKCGSHRKLGKESRRFIYLSLKPRLERLFGNTCMAGVLQSHLCATVDQKGEWILCPIEIGKFNVGTKEYFRHIFIEKTQIRFGC